MPKILGFHSSGEWNQPASLLAANVRRTRRQGRSFGTRTEVTTGSHHNALKGGTWGVYHPTNPETHNFLDCSVEWDRDVWRRVNAYVLTLNPERLHTAKGFLLPPSRMPVVVLEHRKVKRHLLVGAFHLQLANTAARRAAWRTEAATIRAHVLDVRREHPGWRICLQGDGNRNQRITALRDAVQARMLRGTGLHNCWVGHMPARGGTHGPRSLLDLSVANVPGGSRLLPDDGSSDHRPYETWLTL